MNELEETLNFLKIVDQPYLMSGDIGGSHNLILLMIGNDPHAISFYNDQYFNITRKDTSALPDEFSAKFRNMMDYLILKLGKSICLKQKHKV